MASPQSHECNQCSPEPTATSRRETIPAREVGVSLTISDKALREIEQIKVKTIKAAQHARDFAWR